LAYLQPAPQNCGEPNSFFILYSRRGAETQRNCARSELLPEAFAPWRLCALYFFSSRKDLPAVGNCKEIMVARYFFPPRRTGFPPLRLGDFAACPAELRGAKFFFYFLLAQRRRDAKELCSLGITSGGLGVLASLRALFFFLLAKTCLR
jgi:hypothetical protein